MKTLSKIISEFIQTKKTFQINNISKTTVKSPHEIKTELALKSSTLYIVVSIVFIQYSM